MRKILTIIVVLCVGLLVIPNIASEDTFYHQDRLFSDDIFIDNNNPDINYYTYDNLFTHNSTITGDLRTLLYFPSIDTDFANVTIKIKVFCGSVPNGKEGNVSIYRLNYSYEITEVTWNIRRTGTNWDTPGGDYNHTPINKIYIGSTGAKYWDVTSYYWDCYNETYNNTGFMLRVDEDETNTDCAIQFQSTDYGIEYGKSYSPCLIIESKYDTIDLEPINLKITPSNPMENSTIDINITIQNNGNLNSGQFNISFYINDTLIGNKTINDLNGNATRIYANITYATSDTWGNHTINVTVDSNNEVTEFNENNNNINDTVFFIYDWYLGPNRGKSTDLIKNTWNLVGYVNFTSKNASTIYSGITNCTALSYKNATSGYWYTYWPEYGILENENLIFGDGLFILTDTNSTWDHT